MKREELERILDKLPDQERQVFNMRRDGKTILNIAEIIPASVSQVYKWQNNIFRAFGNKVDRWEKVVEILRNEESEEVKNQEETVLPHVEEKFEPIIQKTKNKFSLVWFLFVLGVIVFLFVGWIMGSRYPLSIPPILASTVTSTVGKIAYEGITTLQPLTQISTSTSIPLPPPGSTLPTSTFTPTVPTNTPTFTATLTYIPTITVPPPGTVLFEDNFDNNCPGDGWITEMTVGDPVCSQGRLTAISEAWLFMGNPQWKNYKIEFDKATKFYTEHVGIGVHVQDKNTMYLAYLDYYTYKWFRLKQGQSVQWPDSEAKGDISNSLVTITVKDAHYTISISGTNGQIYPDTTITDNTYPTGYVAINVTDLVSIDNLKITTLP